MDKIIIKINNKNVKCVIERKKVKNINIRIKQDGILYISASKNISTNKIISIIKNKEKFIINALDKITQNNSLTTEKEKFNKVYYLGTAFCVNFILCENNSVYFSNEKFTVHISSDDLQTKRLTLKKWYMEKAVDLYAKINDYTYECFLRSGYKIPKAVITIKEMKTRWGSCNPSKAKISMNLKLMEYPEECIYGVFFHEYCHFIHQNHSEKFYSLLKNMYPDYKLADKILKTGLQT